MYLIFDTETTGLPKSYRAPASDVDNWPRIVQIAWETFDSTRKKTTARSYIVRPEGFEIPKEAEKIHGISTARATKVGIPIKDVLMEFRTALTKSSSVVAHNMSYDSMIVGAEFYRIGVKDPFADRKMICTKEASTTYCAIPGNYGYKWPKLDELHLKLFGENVKEAHDASVDVTTCAKCFFELQRLGVIRACRE